MSLKEREEARYRELAVLESELRAQGYPLIAGIDEAGRGPLAGPVAAAACILDPKRPILGLNDSKKVSEKKRERLYDAIREQALAAAVVFVQASEIDRIGINPAVERAMREAVAALAVRPTFLLLDACSWKPGMPYRSLVKGDARCNCIAAASILAKVSRDRFMKELDARYPLYGFARHKGYGTAAHAEALRVYGPCPEHRRSFIAGILQRAEQRF